MNSQKIALLTDSCADIPPALLREKGIYSLPLKIIYPDHEYSDGVDITPREIYEKMPGQLPTTSLPDGDTVLRTFSQIRRDGYDKVLALCFSSGLSGTYNIVRLAGHADNGLDVAIYDTLSGSMPEGMMVLQAARWIEEGKSWEELQRLVPPLIANTCGIFTLDTLEYLKKGGRIGLVTAVAGGMLQIKPIITFSEDGRLISSGKVRGRAASIQEVANRIRAHVPASGAYNVLTVHSEAPEDLAVLESLLSDVIAGARFHQRGEIDCTLAVHVGPGLVGGGISCIPEE